MGNIEIKPASIQDFEEIYKIELECFGREAYSRTVYRWLLTDRKTIFLKLVDSKGTILGFAAGRCERLHGETVGKVYTLNIRRAFRGRGFARKLMEALEEEFRRRGCRKSVLQVAVDNEPAVNLYLKLGYRITHRLPNYYGPGRDGYEAEKAL